VFTPRLRSGEGIQAGNCIVIPKICCGLAVIIFAWFYSITHKKNGGLYGDYNHSPTLISFIDFMQLLADL
jgi:hypothetical protein